VITHSGTPAKVRRLQGRFRVIQDPDDLLFPVPALLQNSVPFHIAEELHSSLAELSKNRQACDAVTMRVTWL
jgi:hypothetical protein